MKTINFKAISIITLSLLFGVIVPNVLTGSLSEKYFWIFSPLIWTAICIISFIFSSSSRVNSRYKNNIIKNVTIITLTYLIIYYLSGLIFGFLISPYSHSIVPVLKNIWAIVYVIILEEYVRFYLANSYKKSKFMLTLISLLFILISLDIRNLPSQFVNFESTFKYICSALLPLIISNFLFTYLAINAGNIPATICRVFPKLLLVLMPVFPDINWYFSSLLEIFTAFFIFVIVRYNVLDEERINRLMLKSSSPLRTLPVIAFCVIFVCFVAGFFKLKPVAIMSDSMAGAFSKGDVVIINKISTNEELKIIDVGDIIEYTQDNKSIIHRVVKVNSYGKAQSYITKGDSNAAEDPKEVQESQITGKLTLVIPKLGMPSVFFSNMLSSAKR